MTYLIVAYLLVGLFYVVTSGINWMIRVPVIPKSSTILAIIVYLYALVTIFFWPIVVIGDYFALLYINKKCEGSWQGEIKAIDPLTDTEVINHDIFTEDNLIADFRDITQDLATEYGKDFYRDLVLGAAISAGATSEHFKQVVHDVSNITKDELIEKFDNLKRNL